MDSVIENKKVRAKDLLACREYAIILIANFISRFGDSIDSIAYGWMVYQLTGSKVLLGTLFAVNALPNIVFGPIAGVMADRFDKKKVIVLVYIGRGIVVSFTAYLFLAGLLQPWHLFIFTLINSSLETLSSPIFLSVIPLILPKELFMAGNSFSTSAYKFAELVGLSVTGVIITLLGISGAIFVDGATFFIAAFLIFFLKLQYERGTISKFSVKGYLEDLKEGFRFIGKNYLIRTTLILFAIINFCLAPLNVLLPAYVDDILKGDAGMLSILGVSLSVGIILGGLVIGTIGNKVKKFWLITIGLTVFGISYAVLFLPGNLLSSGVISNFIATLIFFLFGFNIPMMTTPLTTNIMLNTEKTMLGRVGSLVGMISCCAIPLGSAITGSVSEIFSMTSIFAVMGAIITFIGLRMLINKKFRQLAG